MERKFELKAKYNIEGMPLLLEIQSFHPAAQRINAPQYADNLYGIILNGFKMKVEESFLSHLINFKEKQIKGVQNGRRLPGRPRKSAE